MWLRQEAVLRPEAWPDKTWKIVKTTFSYLFSQAFWKDRQVSDCSVFQLEKLRPGEGK